MKYDDAVAGCLGLSTVLLIILACVVCAGIKCNGGLMPDYSEGSRTGRLMKISKKGAIWKSWEGHLLLTDFVVQPGNVWQFSLHDDTLAQQMQKLEGKRVTIYYTQHLVAPAQQGTSYTATKVELVEP